MISCYIFYEFYFLSSYYSYSTSSCSFYFSYYFLLLYLTSFSTVSLCFINPYIYLLSYAAFLSVGISFNASFISFKAYLYYLIYFFAWALRLNALKAKSLFSPIFSKTSMNSMTLVQSFIALLNFLSFI